MEIIRRSPFAPHAGEITFPDRYSLAAIRADAYAVLPEQKRDYLADQFYNDSFWFDQLACSSPRLLVWCGQKSSAKAASSDFFAPCSRCCFFSAANTLFRPRPPCGSSCLRVPRFSIFLLASAGGTMRGSIILTLGFS